MTFSEVWDSADEFLTDFQGAAEGTFASALKNASVKKLYYLMYARFGNSPIANMDVNQFKLKVHSIMFQFGPEWEKKLEIQDNLRGMSEADLLSGSKTIVNRASNPSGVPSTSSLDELDYIDEQSTDNVKRGKLEAYAMIWQQLKSDVTSIFLDKFRRCFKVVVRNEHPVMFGTETEE